MTRKLVVMFCRLTRSDNELSDQWIEWSMFLSKQWKDMLFRVLHFIIIRLLTINKAFHSDTQHGQLVSTHVMREVRK